MNNEPLFTPASRRGFFILDQELYQPGMTVPRPGTRHHQSEPRPEDLGPVTPDPEPRQTNIG